MLIISVSNKRSHLILVIVTIFSTVCHRKLTVCATGICISVLAHEDKHMQMLISYYMKPDLACAMSFYYYNSN